MREEKRLLREKRAKRETIVEKKRDARCEKREEILEGREEYEKMFLCLLVFRSFRETRIAYTGRAVLERTLRQGYKLGTHSGVR